MENLSQKLFTAKAYLAHWWHAGNANGLHSPFMFDFYTRVVRHDRQYYVYEDLENLRKKLRNDDRMIEVTDLGAGSRVIKGRQRKVGDIARHSVSRAKVSRLLFRMVDFYKPENILELGTSLGINTLYLATAHERGRVFTLEGCPNLARMAAQHFQQFGVKARIAVGDIADTLPKTANKLPQLDMVFFDANHRYQPTIEYFETCLPKATEASIFVFDDIHWSEGMHRAWLEICARPEVMLSVDLFHVGVVFFRKKQPKQHFKLRF